MENYESIAYEIYSPIINKYGFQFAAFDNEEFFLIGRGFALWVFVDRRDRRADTWYVSVNNSGNVLTYTLMYINKQRFTSEDRAHYGKPTTLDDYIEADMRVITAGLLNRCQDILTGDKTWLHGYQDDGDYSRHVARFLKPYFEEQGYYVAHVPESYNP